MKMIQKILGMLSLMAAAMVGSAEALELKDLHLPMTRDEADKALSKDYDFTILSDSTVRRSWKLSKRKVHVDFKLNSKGQALCIAVEYTTPAPRKVVDKDIKAVTGGSCDYQKLGRPKKDTNTYGMEHAMGAKLKNGGWIFVEHSSAARQKCTRFVYYATKPSRDRLSLGEAQEDGGYTAMGSAGSSIDISALVADEEDRRRATVASKTKPSKKLPAPARTPKKPMASTQDTDDDIEFEGEEGEKAMAETAPGKGFLPEKISAPVQKLIGLSAMVTDVLIVVTPLLLLFIVWRILAGRRRAKAHEQVFDSVINQKEAQPDKEAE